MDKNIIDIYRTLLNRPPSKKEMMDNLHMGLNIIKSRIKNSNEFKNFNKRNLYTVKNVLMELVDLNDIDINLSSFLLLYISFKYNIDNFKNHINKKINNIESKYKFTYFYYLGIEETPSKEELLNLLLNYNSLERYICTSNKFLEKSNDKINELNRIDELNKLQ